MEKIKKHFMAWIQTFITIIYYRFDLDKALCFSKKELKIKKAEIALFEGVEKQIKIESENQEAFNNNVKYKNNIIKEAMKFDKNLTSQDVRIQGIKFHEFKNLLFNMNEYIDDPFNKISKGTMFHKRIKSLLR